MSKHRLIFYAVALAVLFAAYVGYRLYENRVKTKESIPLANKAIQFEDSEKLKSTDRTFLQREETIRQLPRDVKSRPPSLNLPLWTYTSEKWDNGAVDSVKVIALPTDVAEFHVIKVPDGKTYRLPLPKEKMLLERDIISDREVIYIRIFTTPENTPEIRFDDPIFPFDVPMSDEPPIPYPLIAKFLNKQDDTSLTQLGDWIKSVGGEAQAQALLEQARLSDSVRIEALTISRQ
jgi:hypothetical protein